jgi:ABC-2 type transport system permease protein
MRNTWIIFKRELMAYFYSPIAYIVAVCVLLLMGISFFLVVMILTESPSDYNASSFFLNGIFMWIVLLLVIPVITMRLFADEKRMGTIESLMTTPLRDIEYVLGKFFAGYLFFLLLWVPTFHYTFLLRYFSNDQTPLDLGPIVGGYVGLFLIGMLLVAVGCLASALTRNQIISAVVGFTLSCILFFSGLLFFLRPADQSRNFFESFSMLAHMQEMSRGLINWRYVVFYFSGTALFLFITHRVIQSRQWKS